MMNLKSTVRKQTQRTAVVQ